MFRANTCLMTQNDSYFHVNKIITVLIQNYCTLYTVVSCLSGNQPTPLASVESYNQLKRRWEAVAPLPSPRCSCASIQTPDMLFLIGGVSQGPSNAVEALCLKEAVWHTHTLEQILTCCTVPSVYTLETQKRRSQADVYVSDKHLGFSCRECISFILQIVETIFWSLDGVLDRRRLDLKSLTSKKYI